MSRFDIVSLTLAEVALVALFAFVAVTFPSYGRLHKEVRKMEAASRDAATMAARLRKDNEDLRKAIATLESDQNLRSQAMPSCIELHKALGSLFVVTVAGANEFIIGGRVFTHTDILREYSSGLREAERNGCRHRVDVLYRAGTSAQQYVTGLRILREHFYTTIMGAEN